MLVFLCRLLHHVVVFYNAGTVNNPVQLAVPFADIADQSVYFCFVRDISLLVENRSAGSTYCFQHVFLLFSESGPAG
ncbi:Uncharacterised protein [Mycobacteroides abscessus subsp. massiliense]|nr:Uncharacterised protein [Mycobacteroides abscessus subsp. massiliense]